MPIEVQKTVSLVVSAVGLALLVMMIIMEDEFGALPLLLLIGGLGWYATCRAREKSAERKRP